MAKEEHKNNLKDRHLFLRNILAALGLTNPFGFLSSAAGALSLIRLLEYGFTFGWSEPFRAIIETYNNFVSMLFRYFEPLVQLLITQLEGMLDIEISLFDHWHHVFIVLSLYIVRLATFAMSEPARLSKIYFIFLALTTATIGSAATGAFDISRGEFISAVCICLAPLLSLYGYQTGVHLWRATFDRVKWAQIQNRETTGWMYFFTFHNSVALNTLFKGVSFSVFLMLFESTREFLVNGILFMPVFILYAITLAYYLAAKQATERRGENESWAQSFWRTNNAITATALSAVYIWALVFILLNAGYALVD